MVKKQEIKLFEEKRVRSVWDSETEEWYFSVVDVVEELTDSADPKQYIKKMRRRDPELDARWGTICTLTQLKASADVARRGGNIAKTARKQLEEQTGRSALSSEKASDYILPCD